MSLKKPRLFFLICGLCVTGAVLWLNFKPLPPVTPKSFSSFPVSQYSSRGVVDRIIGLKIETTDPHSEQAAQKTEVVAFVTMPFDFEGSLHYKWTLGQNLTLIEGALEGDTLTGFKRDEPQKIKIVVQGYSAANLRHIGFEISGEKQGHHLFADGLISSQKDQSFESFVQHVEKLKAQKSGVRK